MVGDGPTDERKKWHREVGARPKNRTYSICSKIKNKRSHGGIQQNKRNAQRECNVLFHSLQRRLSQGITCSKSTTETLKTSSEITHG